MIKETFNKIIDKTHPILFMIIVFSIVFFSSVFISKTIYDYKDQFREKACQDIGFIKYDYKNEPMCLDKEGYWHMIDMDCNFMGSKCNASEILIKIK